MGLEIQFKKSKKINPLERIFFWLEYLIFIEKSKPSRSSIKTELKRNFRQNKVLFSYLRELTLFQS